MSGRSGVSTIDTPHSGSDSSVVDSDGAGGLIQSVARLIRTQTDVMAAQTKVMTAQSLPPLRQFIGEGSLVGDESFVHWHEQFEERSLVAGWSEEEKKYGLKMHLHNTAFQAYRMGPNLLFDISVEGVVVAAVVHTGSQATIISRALLHKVNSHVKSQGKSLAKLEVPSMPLYGKGGSSERELDITAQVKLTLAVDGRKVTVPVFIQPNSWQACLLGTNALFNFCLSLGRKLWGP